MKKTRKTDSKKKIKDAFIQLLETEGYHKMNISNISKVAKINRGTFYLNYFDKIDLWNNIKFSILNEIESNLKIESYENPFFSKESLLTIIEYLNKNKDLLSAIINSDLSSDFISSFYKMLIKSFSKSQDQTNSPIKQPYAYEIVFSSVATIFTVWVKRDMKETPEELLKIIQTYRTTTPVEILKLID